MLNVLTPWHKTFHRRTTLYPRYAVADIKTHEPSGVYRLYAWVPSSIETVIRGTQPMSIGLAACKAIIDKRYRELGVYLL